MALIDALRAGVKAADTITLNGGLQSKVRYQKYVANSDGYGTSSYEAEIEIDATVDWKQRQVRTPGGVLSVSRAYIGILRPMDVDDNDIFILPDGTTGPILDMDGYIDKDTKLPVTTGVYLG